MTSNLFGKTNSKSIELPKVERGKASSFTDLLYRRRSVRRFADGELTLEQISQILFAAQGITRKNRFRTSPSAGALYPLEVYLVAGQVQGLEPGIYKYRPHGQEMVAVSFGDKRDELARQSYGQMWIAQAQAVVVICAVYERVTGKYGDRGVRYVHIEAGCAAQNLSLAGYGLGLGSTVVGAFSDSGVEKVIGTQKKEQPLIVMPVGLLE
ncbi:MAG: SagB/ThcOx family dehydrogenase [Thermodesulfobacteriota bacterium]